MNKSFIVAVAAVMLLSSLAITFGGNTAQQEKNNVINPELGILSAHNGNVTIYANGTVSNSSVISHSGSTYTQNENVNGTITDLRANITLNGNGFSVNGLNGTAFIVQNISFVVLTGIITTNSVTGVYILNSSIVTIQDSNVSATTYGVVAYASNGIYFYNDSISVPLSGSNVIGIYLEYTASAFVYSSDIAAVYGFYTADSTSAIVFEEDSFLVSSEAIYLDGGYNSNVTVMGSSFNASSSYAYGVDIESGTSNNVLILNNMFTNYGGSVYVEPDEGVNVKVNNNTFYNSTNPIATNDLVNDTINGNYINGTSDIGIHTEFNVNQTVSWNTLVNFSSGASYALKIKYGPTQQVVSNNIIILNQTLAVKGIYLYECGNAAIFNNFVSNSSFAIDVELSGYFSIFDNVLNNNVKGVYSYDNFQFSVFDNNVSNSKYSLDTELDFNGTFYGNTLYNTSLFLLYAANSVDLTFYHNNFLNGTYDPVFLSAVSYLLWNLPLPAGGNYWSNYTGTGTNGIGSTPYTVNGTSVDQYPLTSEWKSYTITFVESGLLTGTEWSVHLGTGSSSSMNSTVLFSPDVAQTNAQATYTIDQVAGYTASVSSGTITFDGTSRVITVSFAPVMYNVTFTETGLASGTTWSVTLNGVTVTSTNSSITFSEQNGTYGYTTGSVSGYYNMAGSGSVMVNGSAQSISVQFNSTTTSPSSSGSGSTYEGIGIGAAIGVTAAVLFMMFYTGTGLFSTLRKGKGGNP